MNVEALRGTIVRLSDTSKPGWGGIIGLDGEPGKEYTFEAGSLAPDTEPQDLMQGQRVYCWKTHNGSLGVSRVLR